MQKVREAERKRQFDEYKDRIGEIVNGIVKRVEFGNVTVDLGRAEGAAAPRRMLPRETFRNGDRVRAYIFDVREEAARAADLPVAHPSASSWPSCSRRKCRRSTTASSRSRRSPAIPAAAPRSPSSRTTAASIRSAPASACAAAASRRWSASCRARRSTSFPGRQDPATFVVNALAPAEVTKVVLDEESRPHRSGGARRPAVAGDRPPRPERAPGLAADRLGHRHPDRGRGIRAPPGGVPHPLADVHRCARRRRRDRPSAGDRRLHQRSRKWPSCRSRNWPSIEGFDEDVAERTARRARSLSGGAERAS